jgi:hypothetical protein
MPEFVGALAAALGAGALGGGALCDEAFGGAFDDGVFVDGVFDDDVFDDDVFDDDVFVDGVFVDDVLAATCAPAGITVQASVASMQAGCSSVRRADRKCSSIADPPQKVIR